MTKEHSQGWFTPWVESLSHIIRGNRKGFYTCVILGILSNGFISAANPLALKYLFDEGIIRGDFGRFVTISLSFLCVFSLWRVGVFLYRVYAQRLKNIVVSKYCVRMLRKFYQLPYAEVLRRDRGYFLSRIYDEVATTAPLVMDTTLTFVNMVVTMVVAMVVAIAISLQATLMVLALVPVIYMLSQKYGKRIQRQSVAEKEEEAKVRGVLERAVGSYKLARVFNLQSKASAKLEAQLEAFISAFFARFKTSTRYEMLSGIFMSYVESMAVIVAGYQILVGRMSFGGFMGFMNAFWSVMAAARGVFSLVPQVSQASGMAKRLREFEDIRIEMPGIRYSDRVQLERVSFAYNGQNVFSDLVLAVKKGERILVVGPNGSGKSTLAHIVSGLLEPTAGITATFPLERISAVIQPCDFVPGTVLDNLGFSDRQQEDRLERLSRELGVADCFDKDPSELSAGQRKRIEILMALLKVADLYIIDEPLAGIDVGSKSRVMGAIFEFTAGRSLLVIMHGDPEFHGAFDRVIDLCPARDRDAMSDSWRMLDSRTSAPPTS